MNWQRLSTFATLSLVAAPVFAQTLHCEIKSKFMCSADSGCQPNKLGVYNILDLEKQTIARCDAQGCDTYPAGIFRSGETLNIAIPDRRVLGKLVPSTGEFVEVVTLVGQVFTSFGICRKE